MPNPTDNIYAVSSNDDETGVPHGNPPAVAGTYTRSAKRGRADSELSPLVKRVMRVSSSRPDTPFGDETSTHPSSPSESGMDTDSLAPSQSDGVDTDNPTLDGKGKDKRRDRTRIRRAGGNLEAELVACHKRFNDTKSKAYQGYKLPKIIWKPDGTATHYSYECDLCKVGYMATQRIGSAETGSLWSHKDRCPGQRAQPVTLAEFGVTRGTGRLTCEEVREYVALWMAESARTFSMINNRYLCKLLHPDARAYLPSRGTISKDIRRLYEASQVDIIGLLKTHIGVFHIALDLFQSSNGLDFLGLVLFRLAQITPDKPVTIERFVLECLSFVESHTGENLAKTVYQVLCKFKIEHRGVVCDNASNNGAMMDKFKKMGLLRLKGASCRLMCILHIYNLAAKAATLPFRVRHAQLDAVAKADPDDEADNEIADLPADEADPEDDGSSPSVNLEWVGNEEDQLPEIESGSLEDEEYRQVTKALWKAAKEARRLRCTPGARRAFKEACAQTETPTPHSIRQDVQTRWNSTELTLEDTDHTWPGLTQYQQSSNYTPRKERIVPEDRDAIRGLLTVLQPLQLATEAMSKASVPLLADVIVLYDVLNEEYSCICHDKSLPLYLRHAADRIQKVLNKYYQKSNNSTLYRLSILLHPSMRAHYMKVAEWETEWIEVAVALVEDTWCRFYRPSDVAADKPAKESSDDSSFLGFNSYMDRVLSSADTAEQPAESPVHAFVHNLPVFNVVEGKCAPFNPLVWWYGQRAVGNERNGLTQMALDVLSAPASSVDVERAFSFAGSIVSKCRHNLSPYTIQATATLGSYSKADLVKSGTLQLPLRGKEKAKKVAKTVLPPPPPA